MSRFGLSTQMLSRCGTTWLRASPVVVPIGIFMALPVCHSVRHVSTTRPKKAQAMKVTLKETAAAPIEKLPPAKTRKASTKSTAAAVDSVVKPAKKAEAAKTRVTKAKASSSVVTQLKPQATTKTAAIKDTPAPPQATAKVTSPLPSSAKIIAPEPVAASASAKTPATAANTAPSSRLQRVTPTPIPAPAAQYPLPPRTRPTPAPPSKPIPNTGNTSKGRADTSSPEYKQAAWRWTKAMIALPVLLVTSYVLYDRLVLGNERSLEDIRSTIRGDSSEKEVVASDDAAQISNTA